MILIILTGFLSFSACNTDLDCYESEDNSYKLAISFHSVDTAGIISDTTLPDLSAFNSDKVDSVYAKSNLHNIKLPLNPMDTSCNFIIETSMNSDTIEFKYKTETILASYECGFNSVYYLQKVIIKNSFFDSVTIINDTINEENRNNLKIWIKERTNFPGDDVDDDLN